jgi:hypothetical protein
MAVRSTQEPATYRQQVSKLTGQYLGFDRSRAVQFDQTTVRATEEIGQAWKIRNEAIVALPEGLGAEERAEKERRIQEDYEEAKGQAAGRLELLLENTPRHEDFRRKLGEWIDGVR